jgi:hypothetical protein
LGLKNTVVLVGWENRGKMKKDDAVKVTQVGMQRCLVNMLSLMVAKQTFNNVKPISPTI